MPLLNRNQAVDPDHVGGGRLVEREVKSAEEVREGEVKLRVRETVDDSVVRKKRYIGPGRM